MKNHNVKLGDIIVLIPKSELSKLKICLRIEDKQQKIPGLGVYNPAKLIGLQFGSSITLGKTSYWLLSASTRDHIDTLKRKAQIILPKDAVLLSMYCDIKPGSKLVEGGLGSGALTIVLLTLVGPTGKVTTYENKTEFATIGSKNIKNTGLDKNWELKQKDITKKIIEKDLDAVILDIPEPWLVVDQAYNALRPGGTFASYLPTMNQVERFVNALREKPFIGINSFETLQRNLVVRPGGVRPAYDMLGHTGYITVGRKVFK